MLVTLSEMIIPILILAIVVMGLAKKVDVYDAFVKGAGDGLKTVVQVLPTLIGLMMSVGVLRASGFLSFIGAMFGRYMEQFGIGSEVVPLLFIKLFSSSAATGLVLDIFGQYGTDSRTGLFTSIVMSCTETCFYTMSIYYMAAKVKRTKWTLSGALCATFVGIAVSFIIVLYLT